jgi:hypothetical protein
MSNARFIPYHNRSAIFARRDAALASCVDLNRRDCCEWSASATIVLTSGGAIIETMVAMAIVAMFLSGVHLTNSQVMAQARSSLESVSATRDLSGRTEQLRASTWSQVTDSAFLKDTLLAVASDAGGDLGNLVETIEVTAPTGAAVPIKVRRNSNGAVTIVNAGDGTMHNQPSARIDVTADWTGKGGRSRKRQATLIVGQGGILGRH